MHCIAYYSHCAGLGMVFVQYYNVYVCLTSPLVYSCPASVDFESCYQMRESGDIYLALAVIDAGAVACRK